MMRWCPVCSGGGGACEPDVPPLEIQVLEASDTTVTLCLQLPRRGRLYHRLRRRAAAAVEIKLAVLGGPDGDLYGPREERLEITAGERFATHELGGLQADTEYTVRATFSCPRTGSLEVEEAEIRTAAPQAACGAASSSACGKASQTGGKTGGKADSKASGGSAASRSGAEDQSTIAPSECSCRCGDDGSEDDVSPCAASSSGAQARDAAGQAGDGGGLAFLRASSAAAVEDVEPEDRVPRDMVETVEELDDEAVLLGGGPMRQSVQCNLCSWMDCLKTQGGRQSAELLVDQVSSSCGAARPAERSSRPHDRRYSAYRPPFPGVPVDAGSVGLANLERQNQGQLDARLHALGLARGLAGVTASTHGTAHC